MNHQARVALLVVAFAVTACADSTSAILQSLRYAVQKDNAVAGAKLNPSFRYLRATVRGKPALLVLGYVEPHPLGPIQIWYSAEREVVRLQEGRVVGTSGMLTEWRNVKLTNVPRWRAIGKEAPAQVLRVRDVMPGYRYGVTDTLTTRAVPPPSKSALVGLEPDSLAWFEETVEPNVRGPSHMDSATLPPSRYAVSFADSKEEVIYAEQCLSASLCFTWQRWPPAQSAETK